MGAELDRTRALLGVIGQAIAQLSLAHTLDTAVASVAELLDADRLAVYLREDERLYEAAGVGLAGPHLRLAGRLLELALGPFRSRGVLVVRNVASDVFVQDAWARGPWQPTASPGREIAPVLRPQRCCRATRQWVIRTPQEKGGEP